MCVCVCVCACMCARLSNEEVGRVGRETVRFDSCDNHVSKKRATVASFDRDRQFS